MSVPHDPFVHLHVHSQYSIADASTRVDDLVAAAAADGAPAVALTDHDNLYGAVHFASACEKHGIKPIFGAAMSIANRPMGEHVLRTHQLNLLATNATGYRNLLEIVSRAHLDAPQGASARISHEFLEGRTEGLLALTGNLSGEVPNAMLRGQRREAERHLRRLVDLFGVENTLVEVQLTRLREHRQLAPALVELADAVGVQAVASNDVHYLRAEHARAHEVLVAIGLGIQARPDPDWLPTREYNFASAVEMRTRFGALGLEALCGATLEIADRVDFELGLGTYYLPQYKVPEGFDIPSYFGHVAREGLAVRLAEARKHGRELDEAHYRERLEIEIGVIDEMGFPGYFLIVWDFIKWAKENGISVGPGRGSGAGSLVAWSMRITDIDPIPYNLLFERFLNPERVSMPDFDIDFCVKRRGEVIDYVSAKYGKDHVAQIVTFGTLKAKGAIRDCGRVLGVELGKVNDLAKLVPEDPKLKSLDQARAQEPRIDEMADGDPELQNLIETATQLEGAVRQTGMHAAGIVISEEPLWHYVPVARGINNENVTMFAKDEVEKAGLVKFDFLGLKNLTMITHCVEMVNDARGPDDPLDLAGIPLDDQAAFAVISRGETAGIFQCESSGFTRMMQDLQPTEFEDLIAAGALYRPGPLGMDMHTRYIERKHKREEVEVLHPSIEAILRETYGVIVYQEQVMQIAREMAGYSLGGADILRRAMGKKKKEEMDKQRAIFAAGADERGIEAETATKVFDLMESFANYGFNKSHSAAYGLITYQTAWLKAHYPTQFFAALLTSDSADTDKVVQYIQEARRAGIEVLPPDVNKSQWSFSVADDAIRFGLGAVKNVGEAAIEAMLAARADGPFETLFDLCRRVGARTLNRRALEQLVKCGALDGFGVSREVLWATVPKALERANEEQRERETGQVSLFGDLLGGSGGGSGGLKVEDAYSTATESWTLRQVLEYEKETLGFYVTGHPLDRYADKLYRLSTRPLSAARDPSIRNTGQRGRAQIRVACMVVAFRERITARGSRIGFLMLEDLSGQAEVMMFERSIEAHRATLALGEPLLITMDVSADHKDESQNRLMIAEVEPLDAAIAALTDRLCIDLRAEHCRDRTLAQLRGLLERASDWADEARACHQRGLPIPPEPGTEAANDAQSSADSGPTPIQQDVFASSEPAAEAPAPADRTVTMDEDEAAQAGDPTATPTNGNGNGNAAAATPMSRTQIRLNIVLPGEGIVTVDPKPALNVAPTPHLLGAIERIVGRGAVRLG
ncbi:MAG: hypothetical protein RIT45_3428 [Pseudomonadota bacterium]